MDFEVVRAGPKQWRETACDALLIVVDEHADGEVLGKELGAIWKQALDDGDLALEAGRTLYLHRPAGVKAARVVFAAAASATPKAFRAAVAAGLAAIKGGGTGELLVGSLLKGALGVGHAQALVAAVAEAVYVYRHTKPSAKSAPKLKRVALAGDAAEVEALRAGLARGEALAAGVGLARELVNRPGNHCTPSDLAAEARRLARSHGLQVEVLGRKEIEKLGMGCFLAVTQASHQPPKFIVLEYRGARKSQPPVVLVGKGITFDTGGVSLKPAPDMDEMKTDMGGAASVLGTLRAVAAAKPAINVIGLIPTCENMPGGAAVKPGDVVTSLSGQTVEILNTDAEGRLILCDALTYAERFEPALVIDIATLTGACVVALGHHRSGLFCADDTVAAALLAAGETALDPCWRMPLDVEYDEALKSNFADMANVGPRAGGAITAAMFLKRYTAKYPWAHLDIAGVAFKGGANKGATGRPVPLLTQFLLDRAG
ncbi:MAG: leucyl aminopeptidase [Burkholderiales bacterium]|nr:leucyl aminopeptidase [Burkholderiales bacterium]